MIKNVCCRFACARPRSLPRPPLCRAVPSLTRIRGQISLIPIGYRRFSLRFIDLYRAVSCRILERVMRTSTVSDTSARGRLVSDTGISYQIQSFQVSRVRFLYPDGSALAAPGRYKCLVSDAKNSYRIQATPISRMYRLRCEDHA